VSRVPLEIPKVGLVMENARLVRWLKSVGETVKQGEPLLELETEKSVVEIESTESGRLVEILLQAEQEVQVGDRVAWLENDLNATATASTRPVPSGTPNVSAGTPGASAATSSAPASREAAKSDAASSTPTAAAATTSASPGEAKPATPATQSYATGRVKSSPVARRLATEHSLDLRQLKPTGPRGRVQLSDVRRAIESQQQRGTAASSVPSGPQPLSSMRRAVARSMTLSNATIPQFFVERAVDWTTLRAIRTKLLADLPASAPRPSVNDFILQAIARSLLAFPELNATFSGDANSADATLLPAHGTHIGLVVAVENGLLVPVLHEVEKISIVELARRRSETVQRASSGRLRREELEGATFSLSNLGTRGPDRFSAIISPPQSAILAVGRQRDCVVAIDGGIHVRPMSQLTLTVDHRVADGRLAADFLAGLVEILEGHAWQLT
jgi:pyruvate dehydrogenase E2 component (dihydrolipoamide acetyltransferase)